VSSDDGGGSPPHEAFAGAAGEQGKAGQAGEAGQAGAYDDEGPLHQDPPKPVPDFPFDPSKVYLQGRVTNFDDGIALLSEPNTYLVAGNDLPYLTIYDNKLLYVKPGVGFDALGIHTVVPDYVGSLPGRDLTVPLDPTANDLLFDTPGCPAKARGLLASPDGRLIYLCPDQAWYEGDQVVYAANDGVTLMRFGNDGLVLAEDRQFGRVGTLKLPDGILHTSADAMWQAKSIYRAHGSGFRFVPPPPLGDERPELWNIDADGNVERVGSYPLPPDGVVAPYPTVLTPDDTLVELAVDSVNTMCAIQRTLIETTGKSEIIYAEKDKPRVWASGASPWLLTGP
jgi:hypothetical protein